MAPSVRVTVMIFVCLSAIFLFFNYMTNRRYSSGDELEQPRRLPHAHHSKRILLWEPSGNDPVDLYLGLGKDVFARADCRYQNCITMKNRNAVLSYRWDAVIVFSSASEMINVRKLQQFFNRRSAHQLFVYMELESPSLRSAYVDMKQFFNLTTTYRLDSDIPQPYGWISDQEHFLAHTMDNISFTGTEKNSGYNGPDLLQNKTKVIAWFASNCGVPSKRDQFVTELRKYVPVDVYGKCGTLHCSKQERTECYQMLETKYKFYLSFENSLCTDYVTEKLFNVMRLNVIPIVMGGANYSRLVPPHSVINVAHFKTVKQLATYVKKVAGDPELYNEYFWWKKYYFVHSGRTHVLCKLCEMLNENYTHKAYYRVSDWFHEKGVCFNPNKSWP